METRNSYIKKLEDQLNDWGKQLDKLSDKAAHATGNLKEEYQKQIEVLKNQKEVAGKRLQELRTSADAAWEELKAGTDTAWEELKVALEKAVRKFKD